MHPESTPSTRYREYLQSPAWAARRTEALKRAENRCQICNGTTKLAAHHRTYERVYKERPADLTILCAICHGKFHDRLPNLNPDQLARAEAIERLTALLER